MGRCFGSGQTSSGPPTTGSVDAGTNPLSPHVAAVSAPSVATEKPAVGSRQRRASRHPPDDPEPWQSGL